MCQQMRPAAHGATDGKGHSINFNTYVLQSVSQA